MLHHTFKQIFRSLWLPKSFTLINLLGLSIGLTAITFIFLISEYENSFGSFHSRSSDLYTLISKTHKTTKAEYSAAVPYPTGQFLLTGLLALLLAFITISYQAIKAASANPIKSLRTE